MKTLEFNVNEQKLTKNKGFDGLAKGSQNYVTAKFSFDSGWRNFVKVAEFGEYPVLIENNACVIPSEALTNQMFSVRVVGQKGDVRITTNTVRVRQEG